MKTSCARLTRCFRPRKLRRTRAYKAHSGGERHGLSSQFIEIGYRFVHQANAETAVNLTVRLDPKTLLHILPEFPEPPPDWTRLDVEQCKHCPLSPTEHVYCPVALSVVELVEEFNTLFSFAEVEVVVSTAERTVSRRTSTQKALSSVLGLYMATSGCPSMDILRPMARFHLPFATKEETLYRVASTYLLGQYFRRQKGQDSDLNLEGLAEAYQQIHEVNMGMAQRLRSIAQGDAHLNAVVLLDLLAHELPGAIDLKLRSLESYFGVYLETEEMPAAATAPARQTNAEQLRK